MSGKAMQVREPSARYLAKADAPDVSPGYKRTEVGVIPFEWKLLRIRDVCVLVNGRGFKPHEWRDSGLPIIRIQNLNGSDEFNYFDGNYNPKLLVNHGQLLFAWSGSRGTSFGPHLWSGAHGLLNYHTWKVMSDEAKVDHLYFFHALRQLTTFIEERAHGASALVHTQKWEMEGFQIATPPLCEQHAIAEALSDVDALLGALEALIAKKRAIKQAAMQQLLTGKTRLPGFSGEWETKRLGEISTIAMGRTPSRSNSAFWGLGHVWLSIADLQGKVVSESKEQITDLAVASMTCIPRGTLLMRFKLSIGRLCFAGCDLFTNEAICSFTDLKANPDHLFYALSRTNFSLYGKQAVKGYTLNSESLKVVEVTLPEPPEQAAIASVLSDMDAEIDALEARCDKTRALKQGMMQQLLTGRVRLVEPANARVATC